MTLKLYDFQFVTGWDEVIKIVLKWGVTVKGHGVIIFLIIYFTTLYIM
jgi:hypothetical protein